MNSFEKPIVDVPFEGSPPTELVLDDLIIGEGAECESGQIISVDYVGISWSTGIEFDSSWSRSEVLHSISEQDKLFQGGMKAARE